ncbi:iron dicitrate transport regulator FecR [Diaphorobacter sp. HDW4A]|uniref:FecR family protein n=1 Tax=Diaphorobacter sp. HDW4A TaxID=2714924 RepID=UPI001409E97E|nr:FecR domain-containing protein [Diaphorobacter sp. HDW4A]QIL80211.1 iron dicitrate transport regulator FecR [Diaphorobacter sp. HDW4A]
MNPGEFQEPTARRRLEHALLLLARQHGGSGDAAAYAENAFAQWRGKHPLNESAALAALQGWRATEACELRTDLPLPPAQQQRTQRMRRRVLSVLGLAGVAAATACVTRWHWQQPLQTIALKTGLGEVVSHNLPDGTHIDLLPRTRAEVVMYRDRREVRLEQGAMRFDVSRDETRPFIVNSSWGRVRVLGTVFTIDVREERMKVAVAHGSVGVWAGGGEGRRYAGAPDVLLRGGQGVRVSADGLSRTREVDVGSVGAWRDGWLVFDRTPLKEVVLRWNDFLVKPLRLEGGEQLLLTGSFRLRDPNTFIEALPRSLPVKVLRSAQGEVTIVQR